MTQNYLPLLEIVEQLDQLVREQVTGTLFLATKANRSAQIMLEKGEIVFVYYYNKRGEDALGLMSKIDAGRLRLQVGQVPAKKQSLPPTSEILAMWRSGGRAADTAKFVPPAVESSRETDRLSDSQKEILEACLAEYIGPMASIICEEYFSGGKGLESVVDGLASEIPSEAQVESFRELVKNKLST